MKCVKLLRPRRRRPRGGRLPPLLRRARAAGPALSRRRPLAWRGQWLWCHIAVAVESNPMKARRGDGISSVGQRHHVPTRRCGGVLFHLLGKLICVKPKPYSSFTSHMCRTLTGHKSRRTSRTTEQARSYEEILMIWVKRRTAKTVPQ